MACHIFHILNFPVGLVSHLATSRGPDLARGAECAPLSYSELYTIAHGCEQLAYTVGWQVTDFQVRGPKMRWLQLRFDFDSTAIRRQMAVEWESNGVELKLNRSC